MKPANKTPGAGGRSGAAYVTALGPQSVPRDAAAGKWLAMALYNCGARSLPATSSAFAQHPEWAAE